MEAISKSSYWHATTPQLDDNEFPPLSGDLNTDVVIIGAGITGLTLALHCQAAGLAVVVVEAGRVGAGTTGGTSAHLDAFPDQGASRLIRKWGENAARAVTLARLSAIDQIEAWSGLFNIDCDFQRVRGYAYSEATDGRQRLWGTELDAARQIGLLAERAEAEELGLPFPTAGGLRIERQARFHSLRYLQALARRLHDAGGTIHEHTRAFPPANNSAHIVQTERGRITAQRAVVVCTHSAFLGISQFDARIAPYQSYVVAARVLETIPDGLYWDDADPYNYLRVADSHDPRLLIVGGGDHKTGQADEAQALQQLENYVRSRFTVRSFEQRWSAEFFEPSDGLPYVGRVPGMEGVYLATGFSGTGLTFGTVAGRLLADIILDRPNPLAEILSPSRLNLLAGGAHFVAENFNVGKHFILDRLQINTIESLADIGPDEGRLVRLHGQALAVYRSEHGELYTLSPACTHAGCFVQWNDVERTWDCPCHGGRYAPTGERIYGPPPHDLNREEPRQQ